MVTPAVRIDWTRLADMLISSLIKFGVSGVRGVPVAGPDTPHKIDEAGAHGG